MGVKIEENGKGDYGNKTRIAKWSRKYGMMRILVKSQFASRRDKEVIYKMVIRVTVVNVSFEEM